MRREPVLRSQQDGALKAEMWVGRTRAPERNRRWRWDVMVYAIVSVDRTQPGMLGVDGRRHLSGECGYARSERAAWRALRKAWHKINENAVIV